MISAVSLLNKITRLFGFYLSVEHEVQRMDFQRDFRTWSNGFRSREEAEKECLVASQNMPSHGDVPAVFRVESRIVVTRYGSVRNYRGDGARFRDGIMKKDRLR
jgi:hypothetical protein